MKSILFAALFLAASSVPNAAPGGIEGRIDTEIKLLTKGATSQRDLVVYLVPKAPAPAAAKPGTATVTQKKLNFDPHVLPVRAGTTVEFVNEDQVKHNVFVDTECCKVDADTDKGERKQQVFEKPGEYPIVCRLHPDMSMHVLALETDYFVRIELQKDKNRSVDGKNVFTATYRLEGVPPGTYTLRTWHKKCKPIEREVVIADGKIDHLDLVLDR